MKKKQQSSAKFAVILTVVVVVLLAAIVIINNKTEQGNDAVSGQPSIKGQPVLGKDDAPVTVVEFGDYKCPSCKVFNSDIFPKIQKVRCKTAATVLYIVGVRASHRHIRGKRENI